MPGADVTPQKRKRRAVGAGFRQLALQEPVVDGIGIKGDAGQEAHGHDQTHQQAEHQQAMMPESFGRHDEER